MLKSYWVPNVSGGLVISKIEQRTKWDLDSNAGYAQTAERWGFEYALTQIRFMAGYGAVGFYILPKSPSTECFPGISARICVILPGSTSSHGKTHSYGSPTTGPLDPRSSC